MKVITIGRSNEGNDVIIDDPWVSRHHFQIVQDNDGSFRLADFGSTNGTYVNGQKVSGEVDLDENDIIRVGNTIIPWKQYFSDDVSDFSSSVVTPVSSSTAQTGEVKSNRGGSIVGRIIGIVISLVMIIGGLSGELVLRGTDSSTALVVVGALLLVFEIVLLTLRNKSGIDKD